VRRPLSRTLALQGLQGAPGALARRARAMPSLDLRFAETKSLTDWISGQDLMTFSRASSGTFTDSAGILQTAAVNSRRIDHNPLTGESLGLLVEESRTNLWTYSGDFANAAWIKVRSSITSNTIVAPDGTLTGDKLIASTDAGTTHFVRQDVSVTSGTSYTQTIYAKAGEYTQIYMGFDTDNSAFAGGSIIFTLTGNGIAGTPSGTLTSNSITPVGNGWYRCQITATATATATGIFRIQSATGDTNGFTGDGTSGIYIWGAQLEAGAFPTSYIPTTTATATRSADLASITGTIFSSWVSASTHTLFAEIQRSSAVNVNTLVAALSDGTTNNRISLRLDANGTTSTFVGVNSGTLDGVVQVTTGVAGSVIRQAGAAEVNNYQLAANGMLGTADTTALIPTVDQLEIGQVAATAQFNGTIRRLTYWPQRLPNNSLVAITR